jgi:hypothetical protein
MSLDTRLASKGGSFKPEGVKTAMELEHERADSSIEQPENIEADNKFGKHQKRF